MLKSLKASLIASLFLSCAGTQLKDGDEIKSNLSLEAARKRKAQIAQINYDLEFELDVPHPNAEAHADEENPPLIFTGSATIKVIFKKDAAKISDEVFLDFTGGEVLALEVNGQAQNKIRYDGRRLTLPMSALDPVKENWIKVQFARVYSSKGNGLYRFVDPEDQKVYIYSDLEPFYANKIFPCFDQPDLKAHYEVSVEAPADWTVIANSSARKVNSVKGKKKRKLWQFYRTKEFSTYIWALHAGPWKRWSSNYKNIPLKLYARQSLAEHVDYKDWFQITKEGFAFFESTFGKSYPFGKYDQILVPDFNWGGMENVGAVTYNDNRYVFRSKPTQYQLLRRASVILHEASHMWFGNLVTMDWWNGLWLNESFATFVTALALEKLNKKFRLPDAWSYFNNTSKHGAYYKDELRSTHPVDVPVKDTDDAFAIFDAISYGKGASALKQLYYFVGPSGFKKGLQLYFKKHAYGNTSIDDLIQAISQAGKVNLQDWKNQWLEYAGVNTLKVNWACKGGVISAFDLVQSGDDPATEKDQPLRPHKTEIALYRLSGRGKNRKLDLAKTIAVTYSGALTIVPSAFGTRCPDLILANYNDWDYVKLELDSISLKNAENYLHTIEEELSRLLIWTSLHQSVLDGRLAADRLLDLALRELAREKSELVSDQIRELSFADNANFSSLLRLLPSDRRQAYRINLETVAYLRLTGASRGSAAQIAWFDYYLDLATSPQAKERLADWLNKKEVHGVTIDQAKRWSLIVHLNRLGHPEGQRLIDQELEKDKSDYGSDLAIQAQAARPDAENKKYWLKQVYRQGSSDELLPQQKARSAMCCLNLLGQEELASDADDLFFSEIPNLIHKQDQNYGSSAADRLRPLQCKEGFASRAENLAEDFAGKNRSLQDAYLEVGQEMRRCLAARALMAEEAANTPAKP